AGAEKQLGTLGTGNHFIEVCLDENNDVWVMLHSGSRGIGNRIATHFIEKAQELVKMWFVHLPDVDLAYLPQGIKEFDGYVEAVEWARGGLARPRVRRWSPSMPFCGHRFTWPSSANRSRSCTGERSSPSSTSTW